MPLYTHTLFKRQLEVILFQILILDNSLLGFAIGLLNK